MVESVDTLGVLDGLGYLLVMDASVDDRLKLSLGALVLHLGAFWGFLAVEHLKRKRCDDQRPNRVAKDMAATNEAPRVELSALKDLVEWVHSDSREAHPRS
jgi:hypothetical protein